LAAAAVLCIAAPGAATEQLLPPMKIAGFTRSFTQKLGGLEMREPSASRRRCVAACRRRVAAGRSLSISLTRRPLALCPSPSDADAQSLYRGLAARGHTVHIFTSKLAGAGATGEASVCGVARCLSGDANETVVISKLSWSRKEGNVTIHYACCGRSGAESAEYLRASAAAYAAARDAIGDFEIVHSTASAARAVLVTSSAPVAATFHGDLAFEGLLSRMNMQHAAGPPRDAGQRNTRRKELGRLAEELVNNMQLVARFDAVFAISHQVEVRAPDARARARFLAAPA